MPKTTDEYVFEGFSRSMTYGVMQQWLKASGITKHITFHVARHTFATRCIESQCDYKTVSAILGHSNVATTLNLYVHPNIHQKRNVLSV